MFRREYLIVFLILQFNLKRNYLNRLQQGKRQY